MSSLPDVEPAAPFDLLRCLATHLRFLHWQQLQPAAAPLATAETLPRSVTTLAWPGSSSVLRQELQDALQDLITRHFLSAEAAHAGWFWERLCRNTTPLALTPVAILLLFQWADFFSAQRGGPFAEEALRRADQRLPHLRAALPNGSDRLLAFLGCARWVRQGEVREEVRAALLRLIGDFPSLARQFPESPAQTTPIPPLTARLVRDSEQLSTLARGERPTDSPLLSAELTATESLRYGEHGWFGGSTSQALAFRQQVCQRVSRLTTHLRRAQQTPLAVARHELETWALGCDLLPPGTTFEVGTFLQAVLRLVQGILVNSTNLDAIREQTLAEVADVTPTPQDLLVLAGLVALLAPEAHWQVWSSVQQEALIALAIHSPISRASSLFLVDRTAGTPWLHLDIAATSRLVRRTIRSVGPPSWPVLHQWKDRPELAVHGLLGECARDHIRSLRAALSQGCAEHPGFVQATRLVDPVAGAQAHEVLARLLQRAQGCPAGSPLEWTWRGVERELSFILCRPRQDHSGELLAALVLLNLLRVAWEAEESVPTFAPRLLPSEHSGTQLAWLVCLVTDRLADLRYLANERVSWLPVDLQAKPQGTLALTNRVLLRILATPRAAQELRQRRLLSDERIHIDNAREFLARFPVPNCCLIPY